MIRNHDHTVREVKLDATVRRTRDLAGNRRIATYSYCSRTP